jgi:NADPH:quinone reductase
VVISAVGPSAVGIDLRDLYHNETRIYGCDSRKLTVSDSARRLEKMVPYFESGEFRPLPVKGCGPTSIPTAHAKTSCAWLPS